MLSMLIAMKGLQIQKYNMKANKCEVVSRRMRSIVKGNYAPNFNEVPEKRKLNPYDRPTRSLPQYNGRISW